MKVIQVILKHFLIIITILIKRNITLNIQLHAVLHAVPYCISHHTRIKDNLNQRVRPANGQHTYNQRNASSVTRGEGGILKI